MSVRRRADSRRESRVRPEGGRFSVYAASEAELRHKLANLVRKLARDQPRPRDVTVRDCASACWYRLAQQQWAIRGDGRSASWAHRRRRYAAWASRSLMDPHVGQRWVVLLLCSEALVLESPGARERVTGWRFRKVAICRASHLPRPLAVASAAEPESGNGGSGGTRQGIQSAAFAHRVPEERFCSCDLALPAVWRSDASARALVTG
jgi:hypothetical protein